MGAELSVPLSRMPDNTTIFQKTSNTIETMNRILDFLLMNSDVKDMISLSDQEKCKKWLIFGEERLQKVFDKVKISPDTKEGTLFIKKLEVLTKAQDESAKNGCRLLAFFFIRLFQVVGALSLSVMDTKLPDVNYTEGKKPEEQFEKGKVPLLKLKEDKPKSFLGMFRGGAVTLPTNLDFLSEHFDLTGEKLILRYPKNMSGRKIYESVIQPKNIFNNNGLLFEYKIGDNETTIRFKIQKDPTSDAFTISDTTRDNNPILLAVNKYDYIQDSTTKIVQVSYNQKKISFTGFVGKEGTDNLLTEIMYKPISNIMQILTKYKYIEKSSINEDYYKLREFNVGGNSAVLVSKSDYFNSEDPTFEFNAETEYENRKIKAKFTFKIKVLEYKPDSIQIEITNLKNITDQFREIPIGIEGFEQEDDSKPTEEEKKSLTNSSNPYIRRFTIKTSYTSLKVPTFGNKNQNIIQFLQLRFKDIFTKFVKEIGDGYKKSKRGYLNPPLEGTDKDLKFTQLWRAIASDSPVKAFCTARALQLLDKSGLYSSLTQDSLQFIQSTKLPSTITPHVSNSKFTLIQNRSLPGLGQSITTAEGLAALQTLYKTPSPELVDQSKTNSGFFGLFAQTADTDRVKKQDSLEKLIRSFTTDEKQLSTIIQNLKEENPLSQISNIKPSNVGPFESRTDIAKVRALRLQAIKLFQIQFDHTRKVNALLNKLFKIDNRIELRPEILSKGVNGIEEIAQEARDLLTDYYAGCQTEYVKGVDILTRKPKVVAATNGTNT